MLDFNGAVQNATVLLKWKTENEKNINYYEVQHSFNGRDYEFLGNVRSLGESSLENNYSTLDARAGAINYYRLKIVDKNGSSIFSKIISVNMPGARQKIYVLTNPFKNDINLRLVNQPKEQVNLKLYNTAGSLIVAKNFQSGSNFIQFALPSNTLSKGIYLLEAKVDGELFTYRLVKE